MQVRSEITHEEIKKAAVAAFSRSGYDAASVADICKKAGVSKGAFYHHFPSKQKLFLVIMQDWLKGIDKQLFSRRTPGKTIPETILEMGSTLGVIFQVASGQLPMFMEFMIQASRDKEVWSAVIAPYRHYQQRFAEMIKEGIEEGSFREDTDVDDTAWSLMSIAIGILLQGIVDPQAANWEAVTKKGVQTMLDGLKRRSE